MIQPFKHHEADNWTDIIRYAVCRIVGHHIVQEDSIHVCRRCFDVMPQGTNRRQP